MKFFFFCRYKVKMAQNNGDHCKRAPSGDEVSFSLKGSLQKEYFSL
jgi:hypothetical protein